MGRCAYRLCASTSHNKEDGVSFHDFPSDPKLKKKWLSKLGKDFVLSPSSSLCSLHFTADKFYTLTSNTGKVRKRLKQNVVPTEFEVDLDLVTIIKKRVNGRVLMIPEMKENDDSPVSDVAGSLSSTSAVPQKPFSLNETSVSLMQQVKSLPRLTPCSALQSGVSVLRPSMAFSSSPKTAPSLSPSPCLSSSPPPPPSPSPPPLASPPFRPLLVCSPPPLRPAPSSSPSLRPIPSPKPPPLLRAPSHSMLNPAIVSVSHPPEIKPSIKRSKISNLQSEETAPKKCKTSHSSPQVYRLANGKDNSSSSSPTADHLLQKLLVENAALKAESVSLKSRNKTLASVINRLKCLNNLLEEEMLDKKKTIKRLQDEIVELGVKEASS